MVTNRVKMIASGLAGCVMLATPASTSAQSYRYANDATPAVVVECGPGQRAVMTQRLVDGAPQIAARCEGTRVVARQTSSRSVARAPHRTKTKTALMIAGSTATGAGVGGALKGKKGALIGAALGGGTATIYEAAKRR